MKRFADRSDAGKQLAKKLSACKERDDILILALPRGGVPVAREIGKALHRPVDILVARKLGIPGSEEFAMGAIASGGGKHLNLDVIERMGISKRTISKVIKRETHEIERREHEYRGESAAMRITNKKIFLVDDGIATGATMMAAIDSVRRLLPKSISIAVPVAPSSVYHMLKKEVDEIICLQVSDNFVAVSDWFEQFDQVSDESVKKCLHDVESQSRANLPAKQGIDGFDIYSQS